MALSELLKLRPTTERCRKRRTIWKSFMTVSWKTLMLAPCLLFGIAGCTRERLAAHEMGQVDFRLTGTGISGEVYRLRDAVVTLEGPFGTLFFDTEDDPDRQALGAHVVVGDYLARLHAGWRVERVGNDGTFDVEAELLSDNPLGFEVLKDQTTAVSLRFRILGDEEHRTGGLEIALEVSDGDLPLGLCASEADCRAGETCCISGFLGACLALDGDPCPLPDLLISGESASSSIRIEERGFDPSSCAVEENCVGGPGFRRLLRFATYTPNLGDADLILGSPQQSDQFEWAECHQHYHFSDYAHFELVAPDGEVAAAGRKQAFCLLDSDPAVAHPPSLTPRYHCGFQGIQAGWADIYTANLDCQWIDITGLDPGNYTLRMEVNPERILPESNYDNNVAEVDVVVQVDDPLTSCLVPDYGIGRTCGWDVAAGLQGAACTPGEEVSLSCGCADSPACGGDAMLRVCAGAEACRANAAIASSDNACGLCPGASFTCPSGGIYTVLVGAVASALPYACDVQLVDALYAEEDG